MTRSVDVAAGVTDPTDAAVIAHRGFAGVNPENTLAAVSNAAAPSDGSPPAMIEVDAVPSASGIPVVFHDDTLGRVADVPPETAQQAVWETSEETLRSLDILGSGEGVPRLSAVFEAVPPEVGLNVELKNPGTADPGDRGPLDPAVLDERTGRWRPFVERVAGIAAEHDHDVLFSSFYEGALAAARAVAPDVPRGAVFFDGIEAGFTVADRHDCAAVHPPRNMIRGTSLFNESYVSGPFESIDLVERAHDEGRRVNAWTVTTRRQAAELANAGVDGFVADYPLHRLAADPGISADD